MDMDNRKEIFIDLVNKLSESLDPGTLKKIDYEQLKRVSTRLVQFYDECKECQENVECLVKYIEDSNNLGVLQSKQQLLNYQRSLKAAVSHLENKHKLVAEGQFMSIYMCLGLALGTSLGTAFNNMGLGISIGLCIGVAVGIALDADHKKKGLVI